MQPVVICNVNLSPLGFSNGRKRNNYSAECYPLVLHHQPVSVPYHPPKHCLSKVPRQEALHRNHSNVAILHVDFFLDSQNQENGEVHSHPDTAGGCFHIKIKSSTTTLVVTIQTTVFPPIPSRVNSGLKFVQGPQGLAPNQCVLR